MSNPDQDYATVLQRIVIEHRCVTVVDISVARMLAAELLAPEPNAHRILQLSARLPAAAVEAAEPAAAEPEGDLGRLTDSELVEFSRLRAKIFDESLPPFEDQTPPRFDSADRLVEFVETRLEQKGSHRDVPLDFSERAQLLGLIGSVVGDVILVDQLCREHWGYAGLPREGEAFEESPSAEEPTAPADMSNVRRLDNLPGSAGLRSKRPLALN
jgi:hypothetical protein